MKGKKKMKRFRYSAILLTLAMALMACQLIQLVGAQPATPTSVATASNNTTTPTEKASQTEQAVPVKTQMPGRNNPRPVATQIPPQSQAAEIRPKEMRTQLTHLSNLIGYQVLDENGNKLGVATDYIVNTCETYIIYIVMEPAASLNIALGNRVVIPFEAVTINSGIINALNKTIQLHLFLEQFAGAPTLPVGQQLTPPDWEKATLSFWRKAVRIGVLTTRCTGVGGQVYKVAYASQLLGVKLYDGRNNLLGSVEEAILEPESGQIGFYIVKPAKGDGLVMVTLGATNIPDKALLPGATLSLVLLADPAVFWDAPRITSIDQADDFTQQGKMRQYWGR